jgi:pyruvate dehydrogenase E2 component (dihydrolipoamide acetyltransferase)
MSATDTAREFRLPDLGEGLEDAQLVEWCVVVDEVVALNQVLCIVETAKATVELPSPFAGRVVERVGEPGDTVPVGAVIVRLEVDPVPVDDGAPPILVGYGPENAPAGRRHRRGESGPASTSSTAASAAEPSPRPLATPPVRRLARDLGVDLAAIAPGSGPGGAIMRDDVERASRAPEAPTAPVAVRVELADGAESADTEIPVQGVRARIAARVTESRSTIPDASCAVEADASQLLQVRSDLRELADTRRAAQPLTPFALVLRLVVAALGRSPLLNATFDADTAVIRVAGAVHLGVALSTDRGLLVPVIRNAHQLSTLELARELARLADAGRAGTLSPAELTGSTFTVSNFGAFGLDDGYPVINHPEVAILGVGVIRPRAVVVDDVVVARPTVRLTCCFDHRVCDGADAGRFLSDLRDLVEAPARLLREA